MSFACTSSAPTTTLHRTSARAVAVNVRCTAAPPAATSRRAALLAGVAGAVGLSLKAAPPALAYNIPQGLAGERITVCDPGEAGQECRRELLAKDNQGQGLDYNQFSGRDKRTSTTAAPGYEGFEESTQALIATIEAYMVLTPYDKQRPILVKELQVEGNKWVSKYAPGGSSKKESGRAFYNALSELLGHIAFNGLAPMRPSLVTQVENNLVATKALIAKGR